MANSKNQTSVARGNRRAVGRPIDLLRTLTVLKAAYEAGNLGGTQHELFPDVPADSRERALYFTLAPALNYQRKSEGLWSAALKTYLDPDTRFVFDPQASSRGLDAFRVALTRYALAVQPFKQSAIWFTIVQTLRSDFGGDPRVLFEACGNDVGLIKDFVVSRKRDFPYLAGPKLLNYWLYMVSCFTAIDLKNRQSISIIPDLHITRATARLGLATSGELRTAQQVEQVWALALLGTGEAPCDYHAPLWRWSRAGFPSVETLAEAL